MSELKTLPPEKQELKDLSPISEEAQIRLVKELESIVYGNCDYRFETECVAEIRNRDLEPEKYSVFIEGKAHILDKDEEGYDKWISSDEDDSLSTEIELIVWAADGDDELGIDHHMFI